MAAPHEAAPHRTASTARPVRQRLAKQRSSRQASCGQIRLRSQVQSLIAASLLADNLGTTLCDGRRYEALFPRIRSSHARSRSRARAVPIRGKGKKKKQEAKDPDEDIDPDLKEPGALAGAEAARLQQLLGMGV